MIRLVNQLVDKAIWVTGIFLVLTLWMGWQARHFEIDASADTLLTRGNQLYLETQEADQRFSLEEFLLIAYQTHGDTVLTPGVFSDLQAIAARVRQLPRVQSVRSILNVPLLAQEVEGLGLNTDFSELTIAQGNYNQETLRKIFSNHPIYEDFLINREQTVAALQVQFKSHARLQSLNREILELEQRRLQQALTEETAQQLQKLKRQADDITRRIDQQREQEIQLIRQIIADYQDRASLYLGGVHVLGYQLITILKNDLLIFGSSVALMIVVLLALIFRRVKWVIIPLLCCACSVIITVGLFALLNYKATLISSNFIALQLILTLALVAHLIVYYREINREGSVYSQAQLIKNTLMAKAKPCFYAGITTSVGFASLLFSNVQPIIDFAVMMIVAVLVTLLVSLTLFPALLSLFPKEPVAGSGRLVRTLLAFIAMSINASSTRIILLSLLVSGVMIGGIYRLDVENSFINYFKQGTEIRKELSFIDRHLGGTTPLDIIYHIPPEQKESNLEFTAETVSAIEEIQKNVASLPGIGKVLSLYNFAVLAKQLNDDIPLTEYELTAVYWSLDKAVRENLLGSFYDADHHQLRINVRIQDTTEGLNRECLLTKIKQSIENTGVTPRQYQLTNLFMLYHQVLQQLFSSQMMTLGLVYIAVGLILLLLFQSVKITLIALVPNILATLATLGVMGWLGISLDLMTITIASIAMGIAVDDTIHYIHRYLRECQNSSMAESINTTHNTVGLAVIYTSMIIIIGFSLLSFSNFVPSILFGLLIGLALLLALLASLFLVPALLHRFVKQGALPHKSG